MQEKSFYIPGKLPQIRADHMETSRRVILHAQNIK